MHSWGIRWWARAQSLATQSALSAVALAVIGNVVGAGSGWLMLRSESAAQRAESMALKTSTVVTALREFYTYVAIDKDDQGWTRAVVTERPIADDASILLTGQSPADLVTLIAQRARVELWILGEGPSGTMQVLATSAKRMANQAALAQTDAELTSARGDAVRATFVDLAGERRYVARIPVIRSSGEQLGAVLVSTGTQQELLESEWALLRRAALVLGAMVLAVVCVSALLFGLLFKPIPVLVGRTIGIANDELDEAVPFRARGGEIGQLASAVETLRNNMIARREAKRREDEATRRLTRQLHVDRLISDFRDEITALLARVDAHTGRTEASARSLSEATRIAQGEAHQVATASQEIASNASSVAVSVEELASGVAEIAAQADAAFAKVREMADAAFRAGQLIGSLSAAAEKISAVTDMIKAVASQTNLLALNATIEAARAREAGKGFVVVASEVKGLANKTTSSTAEISALVENIQEQTKGAVSSVKEMSLLTAAAQEATRAILTAIQTQQRVSSEIAGSIAATSAQTATLSRSIENVSGVIKSTSSSAEDSLALAADLAANTRQLQSAIETFLDQVRPA